LSKKNYFDEVAEKYDSWFKTPLGAYVLDAEKRLLKRVLPIEKNLRVLDLGCGTGVFTKELVKFGRKKTFALDISKGMINLAKEKKLPVYFVLGDAQRLPFKNSSFDLVVSVTVLEFVKEPFLLIKEAYRVLKPGGTLVLATMNDKSLWFLAKKLKSIFVDTAYRRAKFFSPSKLKELLLKAGFKDISCYGVIFLPPGPVLKRLRTFLDDTLFKTLSEFGAFALVKGKKT